MPLDISQDILYSEDGNQVLLLDMNMYEETREVIKKHGKECVVWLTAK